jgi:NitT/TauT family transport system substrate-binding protein
VFLTALATACGQAQPAASSAAAAASVSAAASSAAAASAAAKPVASAAASAKPAGSAAAAAGGTPLGKVTVAVSSLAPTQLPSHLARQQGFFQQNGLDADVVQILGGASTDALLAGQIQLMQGGKVPDADLGGADLVYIGAPTSTQWYWLISQKTFNSAAELKGKKVGVTGIGTASYSAAVQAVASANLTPSRDVTFIMLQSQAQILPAVESGAVDAGVVDMPAIFQARKDGMKELVDIAALGQPFPQSWPAVSKKYAAAHHDIVVAYLKSLAQALAFEIRQPEQTQKILMDFTKTADPEITRQTYEETAKYIQKDLQPSVQALKNYLDTLAQTNPAAKDKDPAQYMDDSYVKEIKASGFIDSLYK